MPHAEQVNAKCAEIAEKRHILFSIFFKIIFLCYSHVATFVYFLVTRVTGRSIHMLAELRLSTESF